MHPLLHPLYSFSKTTLQRFLQKAIPNAVTFSRPSFQHGYYKEMVALIRGLFGQALKTNDYLQFAVLTGCLRVSKESIFVARGHAGDSVLFSVHAHAAEL